MAYRRVLTVQDISCVGKCSTTVALPILSACGHETSILPTAVLSTHTGGFGTPAVHHMGEMVRAIQRHWERENITFHAVLTGYLGSIAQIEIVSEIAESVLAPGGILIVDPAMADHGKLYKGLDEAYANEMKQLCKKAHILMPNVTEAAILSGLPLREEMEPGYVRGLLEGLECPRVVLTGVDYHPGTTGVEVYDEGHIFHYEHPRVGKNYYGTGDIFAACFTGALLREKSLAESARIAADFTAESIAVTYKDPSDSYGVKFEATLGHLIRELA